MSEGILERLAQGPVLGDGGYVYILRQRGLPMVGYSPQDVLTHADAVQQLQQEFFDAGAEVLQAETFGGTRNRLEEVGQGDQFEAIHRRAMEIARNVSQGRALIAGSVGSTLGSRYRMGDADRVRPWYEEECALLKDLGADFLILETFYFLENALAALKAAKSTGLVTMVTMSCKPVLTSREGFQMDTCAKILKDEGADIVGLNCMQDPALMLPLMEQVRKAVDGPVAAQPVAVECHPYAIHMGQREGPWMDHVLPSQAMADFARRAMEVGIDYIGSCCGSGPEHVRAMAGAMGKRPL
jgi:betaine-homocysteine S-methyltransferase